MEARKQCSGIKYVREIVTNLWFYTNPKYSPRLKWNKDIFRQTRTERFYHQHACSREILKGFLELEGKWSQVGAQWCKKERAIKCGVYG